MRRRRAAWLGSSEFVKSEAFEDAELRFNQVEPGGFRGRPHGLDPELPQQGEKARMIVDVAQVVQNHEKPLPRITTAQTTKSFADVRDGLAAAKHATEAVGVNIVESQELFRSLQTAISRSHAPRVFLSSPSHTPGGLQI